ncbi:uncharacterized protein M8220_004506 isoform 1-T8 [Acridotheres tristis]
MHSCEEELKRQLLTVGDIFPRMMCHHLRTDLTKDKSMLKSALCWTLPLQMLWLVPRDVWQLWKGGCPLMRIAQHYLSSHLALGPNVEPNSRGTDHSMLPKGLDTCSPQLLAAEGACPHWEIRWSFN